MGDIVEQRSLSLGHVAWHMMVLEAWWDECVVCAQSRSTSLLGNGRRGR